mmetsp:Transcript_5557/g.15704  ORF Transcript_5557/g.15704 Transcript_5557/m.15704 type:complete len:400 (-) Transcript_5557:72-1271(-)
MRLKRQSSSGASTTLQSALSAVRLILAGGLFVYLCSSLNNNYSTSLENALLSLETTLGQNLSSPTPFSSSSSSSSFGLAHQQSFGFFDDISDHHWRIAQSIHRQAFPNYFSSAERYSHAMSMPKNSPAFRKALDGSKDWNAENFQEEFHCPLAQRLPSNSDGDGPKWVCDPHRLAKQKDCLVYSFGCNGKVQFEKSLKEHTGTQHCEIHTFDLIAENRRFGNFTQRLEGYSTFHHFGLGTQQQAERQPKHFKTLPQIMKVLGHEGRRIDLFKIDCEWCEWNTFSQWIPGANVSDDGGAPTTADLMKRSSHATTATTPPWMDIRQILVETHNAPMPNARNFFFALHDAGYVIFSKEANYQNGAGAVEFAFLKLSTDFFLDGTTYQSYMERNGGKYERPSS